MPCHLRRLLALLALPLLAAGCNDPPTAAGPAQFEVVVGPSLAGLPDLPLLDTIVIRLVDSTDRRPRRDVPIQWTIALGGGSVVPLDGATDRQGLARAQWTLGAAGPNQLQVRTSEGAVLSFTTSAGAFAVDRLVSNLQSGCGLLDGSLWCWGEGFWESPRGPSDRQRIGWSNAGPAVLDATHGFVDLSLSARSVCGLQSQGTVWCIDSAAKQLTPIPGLPPLWTLTAAQSGTAHCGLSRADSTAWCFVPDSAGPVAVPGSPAFVTIRMEQWTRFYEACGLRVDSTIACWAKGTTTASSTPVGPETPVALPGGLRFVALAKGRKFGCGRTPLNALYCWGTQVGGFPPYSPVLAISDAEAVGALDDWVQVLRPGTIAQWLASDELAPTALQPIPLGLDGVNPSTYGKNTLGCISLADGQVYCLARYWSGATSLGVDEYAPVPPPRQLASPSS